MRTSATKDERQVIQAALKFANLRRINSTQQVQALFAGLAYSEKPFNVLPDDEKHRLAYVKQQERLRDLLYRISKSRAERDRVAQEINDDLRRTTGIRFAFVGGHLRAVGGLNGVEACEAFALALILDENRGLTSRLQQCDAPGCGRFRLDFITKGRPGKYCNPAHKVAAELSKRS